MNSTRSETLIRRKAPPPPQPKVMESQEEQQKRERLRISVINEIVDSEAKYIQDLYTLIIYYINPIRTNNRFPEISSNPKADVKMLFSTIELIFDGNSELLQMLKEEHAKPQPMIGRTFVKMSDKLCQYYGVFCNHQKEAMETLDKCVKTSQPFKSFLEQCAQKPETNNLSLFDYLIKPFQRLLKYPLLMKELMKLTDDGHEDKENIRIAIDKIQEEVDKINKDKAKADNMRKMIILNDTIDSLPKGFKLLTPSRFYIYEGTLRKISGKNDQERHVFLFNDCFMYCKKKSSTEFSCRGVIYLQKLQLDESTEPEFSFKVTRFDKNLQYIFYCKSGKERDTWIHEIKSQQNKLNPSSRIRNTTAVTKREIIRVYLTNDSFKSFAVTPTTTARDICDDCSKKIKTQGLVGSQSPNNLSYKLNVIINGKAEYTIESDEIVMDKMALLKKEGVKFESDSTYFKVDQI